MSGGLPPGPPGPAERDALAGEYVLGTLEAREASAVRQALAGDAELAARVDAWEARLAPLLVLAPPAEPPAGLWARIEAAIAAAKTANGAAGARVVPLRPLPGGRSASRPAPRPSPPAAPGGPPSPWTRRWALGATAVAAGLAALLVLRPPLPPTGAAAPFTTVLLTAADQPAWLAEARDGAIQLASINPRAPVPDRVLQLWSLAPGATAPTSLGLVPPEERLTVTPSNFRPEPGMLIEISLEPPGGSPTGRPTGPVLFIGRLAPARSG